MVRDKKRLKMEKKDLSALSESNMKSELTQVGSFQDIKKKRTGNCNFCFLLITF